MVTAIPPRHLLFVRHEHSTCRSGGKSAFDERIDHRGQLETDSAEHRRELAEDRESGQGVHFVDPCRAVSVDEEIDPRQPLATKCTERTQGKVGEVRQDVRRQCGGDLESRTASGVFRCLVEEGGAVGGVDAQGGPGQQ